MQLIELKGSPYEIGFQHGRIFKERIKSGCPGIVVLRAGLLCSLRVCDAGRKST